jgi:hypothetical protein
MLAVIAGCTRYDNPVGNVDEPTRVIQYLTDPCGDPVTVILYAGQTIDVGTVTVENNEDSLCITLETTGDWVMSETHVAFSTEFEGIPQTNSGNPQVGKFPYKHELDPAVQYDEYCFDLSELGYSSGTELFIAVHAVVEQPGSFCIDFEGYTEKDAVTSIATPNGDVNFYMVNSLPLQSLAIGEVGDLTPVLDSYPVIAEPMTSLPYENIVAFTTPYMGNPYTDDYVVDDNGTGAGGMVLTDPQDETQTPLMWHAYSQFQAIVFDVSGIADLGGISFVAIDLDHGENWTFQYYNANDELIYTEVINEGTMGLAPYEGDGKAYPFEFNDPSLAKVVIWGGDNNGVAEVVGYAFDNICIITTESETAWGNGNPFPGNNWAMWFNYTIQECNGGEPPEGIDPGDFRTQTQGGWGSTAQGENPGWYRDMNFPSAFPSGLTAGGNYTTFFSSSLAVENFLPAGGTAAALTQSYVDPLTTEAGVLLGQVVALTLSVTFDEYDPDFGASPVLLKDLVVAEGMFAGWTVQQVLDEGNVIVGGGSSTYTASDINAALSAINENFVDGTTVGTYLELPTP